MSVDYLDTLTDSQLLMVCDSGENTEHSGFGVELRGAGEWAIARSLVKKGLGTIEGGAPNGSSLPGLYFNNENGVSVLHENDDLHDDCDVCGTFGCAACGYPE